MRREGERERERERESVCVCVCVCERERERECACVCVCVRERERERESVCVREREREKYMVADAGLKSLKQGECNPPIAHHPLLQQPLQLQPQPLLHHLQLCQPPVTPLLTTHSARLSLSLRMVVHEFLPTTHLSVFWWPPSPPQTTCSLATDS